MTEVNNKICFIDSNIWLYAFIETQDSDKSGVAKSVIQNRNIEITVSTQIINEVCVNLIRKAHFPEEKIRELAENFYKKYNVLEINRENLIRASEIREHHNFSFWTVLFWQVHYMPVLKFFIPKICRTVLLLKKPE